MLESYYESPTHLRRKRRGPIGPFIDRFAADLQHRGYTRNTGRDILTVVARFSMYAGLSGVREVSELNSELVEYFLLDDLGHEGKYTDARNCIKHIFGFLRRIDALAPEPTKTPRRGQELLLSRYDAHMRDVLGLTPSTRGTNGRYAWEFLEWCRHRQPRRQLRRLSRADVLSYVTTALEGMSKTRRRHTLCYGTRAFLRYLRWEEITAKDLAAAVPSVRQPRLASVPRHLDWQDVGKMLDAVDVSKLEGRRDRAILLLIATLGLRNIEVRELRAEDIDWRAGQIRIRRTKSRKERLVPLTKETGEALVDYLLHERPPSDSPCVFIRHKAPYGNFFGAAAIGEIVKRHLTRAGLKAPSYGSHLLRHSLATRMVNRGVPIKDIADLLGHESIDTTAIYTKVDVANLATVALPFPGGAQ